MKPHKLQVKLFVEEPAELDLDAFVPVFHEWVKVHKLDGELLIDVADYSHVSGGPGILLVGHESDYVIDCDAGRAGLVYSRKREAPPEDERVADTFRRALSACDLLHQEASLKPLRFGTRELLFRVNDRLLAANDAATFDALKPELDGVLERLFGSDYTAEREGTDRELFTVRVRAPDAPDVKALLSRLS